MRRIKFRGKRVNTREWVYGLFCRHQIGSLICPCIQIEHDRDTGDYIEYIEIDGDTLGQYINLNDIHNVEIYEKDIVKIKNKPDKNVDYEHMQGIAEVHFDESELTFKGINHIKITKMLTWGGTESIEVIGNAIDNPILIP